MTVTIEMVSDIVCPWCWLGKRRIEAAIAKVPELDVELVFRPYELDPDIPAEGTPYKSYMKGKFRSPAASERMKQMSAALKEYGEAEDIPYEFDNIEHRPNSLNAHRVVRWAQGQGLGAKAKEVLFHAFFTEGKNVGDPDVLIDLSEKIGLNRDVVEKLIHSDADGGAVREEINVFRQMGVTGVPTYIANREVAIQGAQDVDQLVKFLKTMAARQPQERPLTDTSQA